LEFLKSNNSFGSESITSVGNTNTTFSASRPSVTQGNKSIDKSRVSFSIPG